MLYQLSYIRINLSIIQNPGSFSKQVVHVSKIQDVSIYSNIYDAIREF